MVTNHLSCGGQGTYYIILAKLIFVKGIQLMSRFLSFFFFSACGHSVTQELFVTRSVCISEDLFYKI